MVVVADLLPPPCETQTDGGLVQNWGASGGNCDLVGIQSLAGWNFCPYSEPNVPLYTAHRT